MQNLFSHSPDPEFVAPSDSSHATAVVIVGVPLEQAFDGFTDAIHLWWPVDNMSVFGDGSHVAFLHESLAEESLDGEELIWADIVDWEAPHVIKMEWTLGRGAFEPLDVDITFQAVGPDACRVLIDFDQSDDGDPDEPDTFVCDWSLILARYARFMGGALSLD